jgi:hypothetical protein
MLVDAMEGPNRENQEAVANTGIFDLCDRILARINFETYFEEDNMNGIGWGVEGDDVVVAKNLERHRVKLAITKCLSAFLEGVSKRQALHMLHQLDWDVISSEMVSCYRIWKLNRERTKFMSTQSAEKFLCNQEKYVEEGMNYYLLLRHMLCYDKSNAFISPQLKKLERTEPQCLQFFQHRAGYIEIVRNEVLERVFFQLPEACVESGDEFIGETVITKMYVMDQLEDFDTKNRDWIMNMAHIVETHVFQENVRRTTFAFTVTKWDLIGQVNFWWTLAMHIIMVFGGFMPPSLWPGQEGMFGDYQSRLNASEVGDGESRRKAAGGVNTETVTEEEWEDPHEWSSRDQLFFRTVLPIVTQVVKWMSVINLLTCGVRFFAFLWSHLPMIVAFALEAQDDDVQGESEAENMVKVMSGITAENKQDDSFFEPTGAHEAWGVEDDDVVLASHDALRDDNSDARALGLKWKEVGSQKTTKGTAIINEALATALQQKAEFSLQELRKFNVGELSYDSYIKVGDKYFEPAARAQAAGIPLWWVQCYDT